MNVRVFGVVMGHRCSLWDDPEIPAHSSHQFAEVNSLAELWRNNHLPHPLVPGTLPLGESAGDVECVGFSLKAAWSGFQYASRCLAQRTGHAPSIAP